MAFKLDFIIDIRTERQSGGGQNHGKDTDRILFKSG